MTTIGRQYLRIRDIAEALEVHPDTVARNLASWGLMSARVRLSKRCIRYKRAEVIKQLKSIGIECHLL